MIKEAKLKNEALNKDIQDTNKYITKHPISPNQGSGNQNHMIYRLTLVRMAIIKHQIDTAYQVLMRRIPLC